MADTSITIGSTGIAKKLHDNADGTYSDAVYVQGITANVDLDMEAADLGVAAEGTALGVGVLMQGDDGTDRTNVLVDTDGHIQTDVLTLPAVTGTVTANLSATDNAVLDAIALAVATEGDALGDGILMQGDDGTDRTNLAVDTDGHAQVDVLTLPAVTGAVTSSLPTSVAAETVQVNAASVAAGAYSVIDATATGGARWAKFIIAANKNHTVDFWGDSADFAAITSAHRIKGYTSSGNADNSSYGGDTYYVLVAGHAFAAARVQNNDGANAATVTVAVSFFD